LGLPPSRGEAKRRRKKKKKGGGKRNLLHADRQSGYVLNYPVCHQRGLAKKKGKREREKEQTARRFFFTPTSFDYFPEKKRGGERKRKEKGENRFLFQCVCLIKKRGRGERKKGRGRKGGGAFFLTISNASLMLER